MTATAGRRRSGSRGTARCGRSGPRAVGSAGRAPAAAAAPPGWLKAPRSCCERRPRLLAPSPPLDDWECESIMSASVFERLQEKLRQAGVAFTVTRHQPVFTSEEAAAVRGAPL